ncbi:hypothetical protein [Methanobacterium sp.]|jgi:hypothetical protein|uniref:hypothetical protein n=1 Tax=Methanobacterium sp. TaxID=2164 RepID=UPI003158F186
MDKYKLLVFIICFSIIAIAGALYILTNVSNSNSAVIGSDNRGYVTKEVYASNNPKQPKIAVITGIHPREKIAISPIESLIKNYASTHDIEITDYSIHVLDQPENFTVGRNNGEELAAQYIVHDIKKSDYNLVIIFHAHQQGYGDGFYIATPSMDNKSAELAKNVKKTLPSFKYYQSSKNSMHKATSVTRVSDPIANEGYPTFVYEIPEQNTTENATEMTSKLLDSCINNLNA